MFTRIVGTSPRFHCWKLPHVDHYRTAPWKPGLLVCFELSSNGQCQCCYCFQSAVTRQGRGTCSQPLKLKCSGEMNEDSLADFCPPIPDTNVWLPGLSHSQKRTRWEAIAPVPAQETRSGATRGTRMSQNRHLYDVNCFPYADTLDLVSKPNQKKVVQWALANYR